MTLGYFFYQTFSFGLLSVYLIQNVDGHLAVSNVCLKMPLIKLLCMSRKKKYTYTATEN